MSTARSLIAPRLTICALIVLACALCASTYSVFGHTWDEPEHLAAGIALLDKGEFLYDLQHPPLARVAMALGPYLAGARAHGNPGPSGEQEGRDILYDGHYDLYLALARIGMLPFLVVLLLATWLWTRRLFGESEALLATALVVITPVVIGHAAVAALDIPMVGTTMLALYFLSNWFAVYGDIGNANAVVNNGRPALHRAAMFGLAAGIAAGTKLSSIPFIGCVAFAWLIAWWMNSRATPKSPRLLLHALLAAVLAVIALCACYGFNIEQVITSFTVLVGHNNGGHLSFFMGELKRSGWWDFYLVAMAVKTPLPLLLSGIAGSAWLLKRALGERNWKLAAPSLAWISILLFASAYSRINIGVRHVLILFPLLAINAAVFIVAMWRRYDSVALRAPLVALLGWQVWGMANAHPDYLPYFNELAGAHPEKILIDSDLDWGQDLRRLKQTLHDRKIEHFKFVYRGTADLQREGFPSFEFVWPNQRATGWIAVGLLAKATGSEDGGYDWLNAYKPVTRVGKSIDLYYIEEGVSD
jgi:hypothetical protein